MEATLILPEVGELRGCVRRFADIGEGVLSVINN
jgi:hypothetical protein